MPEFAGSCLPWHHIIKPTVMDKRVPKVISTSPLSRRFKAMLAMRDTVFLGRFILDKRGSMGNGEHGLQTLHQTCNYQALAANSVGNKARFVNESSRSFS